MDLYSLISCVPMRNRFTQECDCASLALYISTLLKGLEVIPMRNINNQLRVVGVYLKQAFIWAEHLIETWCLS